MSSHRIVNRRGGDESTRSCASFSRTSPFRTVSIHIPNCPDSFDVVFESGENENLHLQSTLFCWGNLRGKCKWCSQSGVKASQDYLSKTFIFMPRNNCQQPQVIILVGEIFNLDFEQPQPLFEGN